VPCRRVRDRLTTAKLAIRADDCSLLLHCFGPPHVIVTDKLRSYGAALKVIGNADKQETGRWLNRLENAGQCGQYPDIPTELGKYWSNRLNPALSVASLIVVLASPAFAQENNLRFGLGISSLGTSVEGAYRFNQSFALRGVLAGSDITGRVGTVDGVRYDSNWQLGGFALLADYYAGNSGFRVSGGAFVSGTSFRGTALASPSNPVPIGNTTLTNGETAVVTSEFSRKISPILTVGYDWNIDPRFTLSGEIGGIVTGGLDVSLVSPTVSAADIATEVRNIQNERAVGNLYPYIAITGSFRF
jgi:hypothetical protein